MILEEVLGPVPVGPMSTQPNSVSIALGVFGGPFHLPCNKVVEKISAPTRISIRPGNPNDVSASWMSDKWSL